MSFIRSMFIVSRSYNLEEQYMPCQSREPSHPGTYLPSKYPPTHTFRAFQLWLKYYDDGQARSLHVGMAP
jgi:hypothetical protein